MKQVVLTLAITLFSAMSFAQKGNITKAAMAYIDAQSNKGDIVQASKDYLEAKDYIDLACAHSDTKESPKGLMYKGKIYIELAMLIAGVEDKTAFGDIKAEKTMEEGFNALVKSKEVDKKERYVDDVDSYAGQFRVMYQNVGYTAYDAKEYEVAMAGLLAAAQFGEIMGFKDSVFYYFGGLAAYSVENYEIAQEAFATCVEIGYNTGESAGYLAKSMKEQGKTEEAETVLKEAMTKYPENLDVLIQMTNYYIDNERNEDAEKVLSAAIQLDPKNTDLIYTSGVIYEGMDRNEDAEAAYKKTIKIDPNHTNAKYSLGVFYFNQGADKNNEANTLPFGDPTYEPMLAKSKEYFLESVKVLKEASASNPKDISILEALKMAYGKAGMVEEFKATKAKIAELKG